MITVFRIGQHSSLSSVSVDVSKRQSLYNHSMKVKLRKLVFVIIWILNIPLKLMCWRLDLQLMVLLGGSENFRRWGLVGESRWWVLEGKIGNAASSSLSLSASWSPWREQLPPPCASIVMCCLSTVFKTTGPSDHGWIFSNCEPKSTFPAL